MREEGRKPKTQERVVIPADLALFLAEVHREIVAGDEVTTIESDDLLQYEEYNFAYGGLTDSETGEYGFRYFPDEYKENEQHENTWDINLNKTDIEKIVTDQITELSLWACRESSCECKFPNADASCFYCDWVEQPKA
ncbi:MAG TPA: hypothetical protein VNI84_02145 [Pyrinomonadaceae bacterium]|nr:hypothetical protein [Pyrinomonadaceae bacterium]